MSIAHSWPRGLVQSCERREWMSPELRVQSFESSVQSQAALALDSSLLSLDYAGVAKSWGVCSVLPCGTVAGQESRVESQVPGRGTGGKGGEERKNGRTLRLAQDGQSGSTGERRGRREVR